ncbi:MAG: putative quinol monooxygenase [Bacteroidia bacterium]
MSFHSDKVEDFKAIFKENWTRIASFKGCSHVELLQDRQNPSLFFTYSIWDSEASLDAYRNSELFAAVWGQTKVLFNDKPQAWSVDELRF